MQARLRRPAGDGAVALSTALRLRLSRRRKSTRRHWPRASLRRMKAAVPPPAAGGLVLSHLLWEASCCLFPAALAAPRQAAVRATARTRVLPGAPSSGRLQSTSLFSLTLKTLLDTHVLDAPTTRANWTEILLPALRRPLPTSLGGWRGLEGAAWAPRRAAPTPQQPNKEPDDETQTRP